MKAVADFGVITTNRVKLPKTFLAVNLSDAFTFQEKERQNSEGDCLDKDNANDDAADGLEMKMKSAGPSKRAERGDDSEAAATGIDEQPLPPPVTTVTTTAALPPAADAPGIAAPPAPEPEPEEISKTEGSVEHQQQPQQ